MNEIIENSEGEQFVQIECDICGIRYYIPKDELDLPFHYCDECYEESIKN